MRKIASDLSESLSRDRLNSESMRISRQMTERLRLGPLNILRPAKNVDRRTDSENVICARQDRFVTN